MRKNRYQAFDNAWNALGPILLDCIDQACDLDDPWQMDRELIAAYMSEQCEHLHEPDLWVITMIMATLAHGNKKLEAQQKRNKARQDAAARKRQAKLPANVIDLKARLKKDVRK